MQPGVEVGRPDAGGRAIGAGRRVGQARGELPGRLRAVGDVVGDGEPGPLDGVRGLLEQRHDLLGRPPQRHHPVGDLLRGGPGPVLPERARLLREGPVARPDTGSGCAQVLRTRGEGGEAHAAPGRVAGAQPLGVDGRRRQPGRAGEGLPGRELGRDVVDGLVRRGEHGVGVGDAEVGETAGRRHGVQRRPGRAAPSPVPRHAVHPPPPAHPDPHPERAGPGTLSERSRRARRAGRRPPARPPRWAPRP